MYIKSIKLKNIRSISTIDLEFKDFPGWHVLIGDNGSGKSTIIRSIALALIGPDNAPALRLNPNEWLQFDSEAGHIGISIDSCYLDKRTDKGHPLKRFYISNIVTFRKDDKDNVTMFFNDKKKHRQPTKYNWGKGQGWFSVAYGPFRRFTGGNSEWSKVFYSSPKAGAHLSVFGEDIALTESLEWLKDLDYKRLKEKENYNNNNEYEKLFSNIKNFLNNSKLLPQNIKLDKIEEYPIFIDGNNIRIDVTELSDGFRSILSLTFELIRQLIRTYGQELVFKKLNETNCIDLPGVVLIDEIDAHLHPTWQIRIGKWFTEYFPNLQFIVTTHSPLICRACDKGTIWKLAAPGSEQESVQVKGVDRDKLIYGNILDAYGTEVFGSNVTINSESIDKKEKLVRLSKLKLSGNISSSEEKELQKLRNIFSTDDKIEL